MQEVKRYDEMPEEQEAVRTTIVGGRPPGPGKRNDSVPRGIEALVKKAAVDTAFYARLLAERSGAAQIIGLVLDPAEAMMLDNIPEAQLITIVHNTRVKEKHVSAFMGYAAAAMLAALGVSAGVTANADATEPPADDKTGEYYEPIETRFAIQPDDEYLEAKLREGGAIEGFVEAINGKIVPGALVQVLGTDFTATADEDGYFKIEGLPPGTYTLEARDDEGAEINTTTVTVVAGKITDVVFPNLSHMKATGSRPDLP